VATVARLEARHCRCGVAFADAPQAACGRHGLDGSTPASGVEGEIVPVNLLDLDQEMKEHLADSKAKILLVVSKARREKLGPDLRGVRRLSTRRAQGGGAGRHRRQSGSKATV